MRFAKSGPSCLGLYVLTLFSYILLCIPSSVEEDQGPLLLTWLSFNPNMDK